MRFSQVSSHQPSMIELLEPRTLLAVLPVVSVDATTPAASENGDRGQFTITLDAPTATALKINFKLTGTATNGTDYSRIPGSVTIPAGQSSALVTVVPIDDGRTEPQEAVVLTLSSNSKYQINLAQPSDTVIIDDATYLAADFFPMTDGARSDYIAVDNHIPFHLYTLGSRQGQEYRWTPYSDIQDEWIGDETSVFTTTSEGIVKVRSEYSGGGMDVYSPPLLWLPTPMTIGDTVTPPPSSYGAGGQASEKIEIVGVEAVTVPAGTFRALKVRTTKDQSDSGWAVHVVSTVWFSRGLGVVKMQEIGTETENGIRSVHNRLVRMTSSSPAVSQWLPRAAMNTARDQFTGGVINGKIYAFGGNGNPDGLNLKSTEVYDPNLNTWTPVANNENNSGDGVEELTSAVVNGKLYVFGAWGGNTPLGYGNFNFSQEYNPDTDTWTSKAPKPTPVSSAPCAVYNGEIYVFGGEFAYEDTKGKYHQKRYNVVEAYSPATDSWRLVTKVPKTVINPALAVVGNMAYLLGGVSSSVKPLLTPIAYDFGTGMWITKGLAPMPRFRTASYSSAAPVVDGKIYLIGGIGGGNQSFHWPTNRVDIYDTATNKWSAGPSLPVPIDAYLSLVLGDSLYVIGGVTSDALSDRSLDTVWQLPLV